MKKLIIFDLDGTLLNTIGDLTNACNFVLSQYGFPNHTHDEYRYFIGSGIRKLIKLALPEEHRADDAFCNRILEEFVERYSAHLHEETVPYDGIIDTLKKCNELGIGIAIASNKYQAGVDSVVDFYFKGIDFIATLGTSDEIPTKPNPLIVEKILEISGCDRWDVLYLGDSSVDMQTAKNADIPAVGVLWGFRTKQELIDNGADYTLENINELWKLAL
ncbi:MAG: HAD family hydrolase [Bacteroidales bacterium]|nr:HAD family hydrolase [Bacteroidales bacterium]